MREKIRLREQELYRFGNALLLSLIILFGAGQFLGVERPGGWHIVVLLITLLLLSAANFLTGQKKWFFLLSMLICLVIVVMTVGIKQVGVFLQAYFRWLTGGGMSGVEEAWLPAGTGGWSGTIGNQLPAGDWSGTMGNQLSVGAGSLTGNTGNPFSAGSASFSGNTGGIGSEAGWIRWYGLLQTFLLTGGCYVLELLLEKVPIVKKWLAGLLALGLIVCLVTRTELGQLGVVFLIGYLLLVLMEEIESHWDKVRARSQKAYIVWAAPFLAAYALLLFTMPTPEEPYDWSWVQDIYTRIRESFVIATQDALRGEKEDFGMAFSGFSGEGELQDGVQERAQAVMAIESKGKLRTNLYLAGKVYDTFDGKGWRQEAEGFPKERFLDTMETLYAARCFDELHLRDYLGRTDLTFRYGYFNTQYVFQPLKLWELTGSRRLDYREQGGSLLWEKQRGYGTTYEAEYFQLNLGEPEFARFLEAAESSGQAGTGTRLESGTGQQKGEQGQDALWNQVLLEYERRTGEKTDRETVEAYWQYVYETYLPDGSLGTVWLIPKKQAGGDTWNTSNEKEDRQNKGRQRFPEGAPSEETVAYLADVIKGCRTKTELLLTIEQELAGFPYTRTPGEMPESVTDAGSFLDYFLLESRQGYCTYFATAFVLLARAAGLPARYVEGFLVPTQETAQYDSEGRLLVYSSMAHAWPEVYLEGIGWIPFEPTPGYGGMRYTPWETSQTEAGGNRYGAGVEGEQTESQDPEDTGNEEGWQKDWEMEIEERLDSPETEEEGIENATEEEKGVLARLWNWETAKRLFGMCGLALAAVLAGGMALLLGDALIRRFRYRRMDAAGKLKANLLLNLQILAWLEKELEEKQRRAEQGKERQEEQKEENQKRELQEREIQREEKWGRVKPRRVKQRRGKWNEEVPGYWTETLQELRERGERLLEAENLPLSLHFLEAYEEVVYGGRSVRAEMLAEAARERKELLGLLKQKTGWRYRFCWIKLFPALAAV